MRSTPDDICPDLIEEINNERLIWSSFAVLDQAIDEMLTDERDDKDVISEREEFLLRELQKMLLAEGLVGSSKDVLVIPARHAWPIYKEHHAYICQAGRTFRPVKYVAFYAGNQIYPLVPMILEWKDEVRFERGENPGRLGELVDKMLDMTERPDWPYKMSVHKVFILSAPDSSETIKLEQSIINDIIGKSGQRTAFTQNQRYVSLEALRKAKKTSELEEE